MNTLLKRRKPKRIYKYSRSLTIFLVIGLCLAVTGIETVTAGNFYRTYWFEQGIEHGNPTFNERFRVNAPEAGLHHLYAYRSETRGNGMMQILIEEDLRTIEGAVLYLEIWGGHSGTANKRVTVNGRTTYYLPEDGTGEGYMAHQYPVIELKTSDLVNGYNVFQFACDQGNTFWGHFIVENAQLRIKIPNDDDHIVRLQAQNFNATVSVVPVPDNESISLSLAVPEEYMEQIASVDFIGFYEGYDENGNRKSLDWHGFTKHRKPVAHLGSATTYPFSLDWDVHMLPAQKGVKVKALIRFKGNDQIQYITDVSADLEVGQREHTHVRIYESKDIPKPFWSRAGNLRQATILLDTEPSLIEEAYLHIVTWDGGAGTIKGYFKLNGVPFPVADKGRHDVIYSVLPVEPSLLRKGENKMELLSDTEHHGIEVLLPGPALVIRYKYHPN